MFLKSYPLHLMNQIDLKKKEKITTLNKAFSKSFKQNYAQFCYVGKNLKLWHYWVYSKDTFTWVILSLQDSNSQKRPYLQK